MRNLRIVARSVDLLHRQGRAIPEVRVMCVCAGSGVLGVENRVGRARGVVNFEGDPRRTRVGGRRGEDAQISNGEGRWFRAGGVSNIAWKSRREHRERQEEITRQHD